MQLRDNPLSGLRGLAHTCARAAAVHRCWGDVEVADHDHAAPLLLQLLDAQVHYLQALPRSPCATMP